MQFANGSRYKGDFKANVISGSGEYHWSDGKHYIGEWKSNMMHGKGVLSWAN